MTNKLTLRIIISEQYTIKCSYIDSNKKETTIQLHNQNQSEMVIRKRIIEENDDDIEFNDVDHSTSDDE